MLTLTEMYYTRNSVEIRSYLWDFNKLWGEPEALSAREIEVFVGNCTSFVDVQNRLESIDDFPEFSAELQLAREEDAAEIGKKKEDSRLFVERLSENLSVIRSTNPHQYRLTLGELGIRISDERFKEILGEK